MFPSSLHGLGASRREFSPVDYRRSPRCRLDVSIVSRKKKQGGVRKATRTNTLCHTQRDTKNSLSGLKTCSVHPSQYSFRACASGKPECLRTIRVPAVAEWKTYRTIDGSVSLSQSSGSHVYDSTFPFRYASTFPLTHPSNISNLPPIFASTFPRWPDHCWIVLESVRA